MNGGIIRNALTTTLSLELEYREPSILCETVTERPRELQDPERLLELELRSLLSVI
jgi:hypothetical protein